MNIVGCSKDLDFGSRCHNSGCGGGGLFQFRKLNAVEVVSLT